MIWSSRWRSSGPGPIQGDMVHPYLRRREGKEDGRLSQARAGEGARQDARRAAVPGAGDAGRDRMRRLHRRRGRPAAPRHGDLQAHRRRLRISGDKLIAGMVARWLRAGVRREDLQPAGGFRQLRLSRKPRGLFRADRLCLVLAEMPSPGCVLRRPAQRPADGLLRARADRPRRPRPWRRGSPRLRQRLALGLHAGADRRRGSVRGAAGPAHGARPRQRRCGRHRRRAAPTGPSPRSTISGAAPACRPPALVQIAEADAFRPSLGLARREALWAIKALRDEPLPLFAAASAREAETVPEVDEPAVALTADDGRPRGGRGLWPCRPDPARATLSPSCARTCAARRIVTCAEAMQRARRALAARPPAWCSSGRCPAPPRASCSSPSRTRPASPISSSGRSSTKSSAASILSAGMLAVDGRIQREGDVVHLVAHQLTDLSAALASVGDRDLAVSAAAWARRRAPSAQVPASIGATIPNGLKNPRHRAQPLHLDAIKVKARDFR